MVDMDPLVSVSKRRGLIYQQIRVPIPALADVFSSLLGGAPWAAVAGCYPAQAMRASSAR